MQRDLLPNGSLKIFLTEEDLREWGLCFDSLNMHSAATKAILAALLASAKEELDFESEHLLVEALPLEEGCLLLFTPMDEAPRRLRLRRAGHPLVYQLDDAESLLSLAEGWCRFYPPDTPLGSPFAASSLYHFGDGYRLVLYPLSPLRKGAQQLLQELATPAGEGETAVAFAAEHGEPMIIGCALQELCQCYRA